MFYFLKEIKGTDMVMLGWQGKKYLVQICSTPHPEEEKGRQVTRGSYQFIYKQPNYQARSSENPEKDSCLLHEGKTVGENPF